MFGRWLRALAVVVGMAAGTGGLMSVSLASASSRLRSPQPPVVRPLFRYVGNAVSLWTGARYAVARQETPLPFTVPATLIDDQNGQAKTIGQAGCNPAWPTAVEPLDLPWVPFNCAPYGQLPAPELYSPASSQWRAVSPNPGVSPSCGGSGCTSYALAAAGRYWLDYHHFVCDSGDQHCSFNNVFQNIGTGELRQDPSGNTTTSDLNAPNLTRTVCRPLRIPKAFQLYAAGPVPGSLAFYGSYALATGGDQTGSKVYLERCGTHLHRLLTKAPLEQPTVVGANVHEIVWMAHPGRFLSALTLPSLRPFTIKLPNRLVAPHCSPDNYIPCVAQIALTNQRLYLLTASPYHEHLWATRAPRPPKRRRG